MLRILPLVSFLLFACAQADAQTEWRVSSSEGLDAVLFTGALSGDKLQAAQFPDEIAYYSALLKDDERAALARIGAHFAKPGQGLAGPSFAYYLAAAPDQSYEGIAAILANPAPFMESFGETLTPEDAARYRDFSLAYHALSRIGFVDERREKIEPVIAEKVQGFQTYLSQHDIIPLQEKYLGRDLDNRVDVVVLHYNKPYGIRVTGQRFATSHQWDMSTTLRTAVHEIFHPPFEKDNPALAAAASALKTSALFQNIVANADPSFGYSTFESILDEDSTQALDMTVSLLLGAKRDPAAYWRKQDDGMHLLAAAIYDAMIETGFAQSGGVYEDWLLNALTSGVLTPETVEQRARKMLGDEAVDKWAP